MKIETQDTFPDWVPVPVQDYLAHTVQGRSIRALARDRDVHPSTILRQVRSCEARRDDPLVDAAISALIETDRMLDRAGCGSRVGHSSEADSETVDVLRRLCEPGALMAVARDMGSAVVVREDGGGNTLRTAVVDTTMAQAMALQNWISCADSSARIARYFITSCGRTELRRLIAKLENRAGGFVGDVRDDDDRRAASRTMATETPLMGLSRRRDKTGNPFLDRDLVRVGERLREDFVLADTKGDVIEDWAGALATDDALPDGVNAARARVVGALEELGPGLQDAALRCCCLLEGLEGTERALGWSARSGKIVLRIALERLKLYYHRKHGDLAPRIG